MSEVVTNSMPKLLSFEHKCKQTKCKQMSKEFENMSKFVLYSNLLNVFHLNQIKNIENCSTGDNRRVFLQQKQSLLKTVESEINIIDETLHLILKDHKQSDIKETSSKIKCDLCPKQLSPKLLTTHLAEHLNFSSIKKPLEDNSLDHSIVDTEQSDGQSFVPNLEHLPPAKEELESHFSDFSAEDFGGFDNDSSDSEEETEIKPKKAVKKAIKSQKSKAQRRSQSIARRKSAENYVMICDECGKTCKDSRNLSHHLSRVHKISKKMSNNCHLCDFGNVSIEELKAHFTTEHNLTVNKWNFHCNWPECGQIFRFRTALDKHIRTHTGDLLYKCEWPGCSVQFNKQWKITEHKRVHTGEKPFVCHWPGCDKAFGKRGSYRGHVLSHNKDKHVCYHPGCDKSYPFKSLLDEHILNAHRQHEKPFSCDGQGCTRTFATKQSLRLHMVIHEDRPRYPCTHEGCERSFIEAKSLEKHLSKPHGIMRRLSNGKQLYRGYKCDWPGCEFECYISTNLRIHRMRAHTGEKPEKCPFQGCDFAAVRKFELKVHILKHTGESPYPCAFPECGRRFKSQRALDTHMSKNHSR